MKHDLSQPRKLRWHDNKPLAENKSPASVAVHRETLPGTGASALLALPMRADLLPAVCAALIRTGASLPSFHT
ncbi:hypothetical protein E0E54_18575 [Azotobacter chroococcum]|uniref:hypothetical protein n=1 Tax=Azotobacter chroococcum TaxID=353 RepID=UPI001039A2E5|nr:hypothetical protein [Azotobacter chroococcum]TBW32639.1 hypothetical protein E0E54_18575 [Azotobacter chroococcum]